MCEKDQGTQDIGLMGKMSITTKNLDQFHSSVAVSQIPNEAHDISSDDSRHPPTPTQLSKVNLKEDYVHDDKSKARDNQLCSLPDVPALYQDGTFKILYGSRPSAVKVVIGISNTVVPNTTEDLEGTGSKEQKPTKEYKNGGSEVQAQRDGSEELKSRMPERLEQIESLASGRCQELGDGKNDLVLADGGCSNKKLGDESNTSELASGNGEGQELEGGSNDRELACGNGEGQELEGGSNYQELASGYGEGQELEDGSNDPESASGNGEGQELEGGSNYPELASGNGEGQELEGGSNYPELACGNGEGQELEGGSNYPELASGNGEGQELEGGSNDPESASGNGEGQELEGGSNDPESASSNGEGQELEGGSNYPELESANGEGQELEGGSNDRELACGNGEGQELEGGSNYQELASGYGEGQELEDGSNDTESASGNGEGQELEGGSNYPELASGNGEGQELEGGSNYPELASGNGEGQELEGGSNYPELACGNGEGQELEGGSNYPELASGNGEGQKLEGGSDDPESASGNGEGQELEGGSNYTELASGNGEGQELEGGSNDRESASGNGEGQELEGGSNYRELASANGEGQELEGGSNYPELASANGEGQELEGGSYNPDLVYFSGKCQKREGASYVQELEGGRNDAELASGNGGDQKLEGGRNYPELASGNGKGQELEGGSNDSESTFSNVGDQELEDDVEQNDPELSLGNGGSQKQESASYIPELASCSGGGQELESGSYDPDLASCSGGGQELESGSYDPDLASCSGGGQELESGSYDPDLASCSGECQKREGASYVLELASGADGGQEMEGRNYDPDFAYTSGSGLELGDGKKEPIVVKFEKNILEKLINGSKSMISGKADNTESHSDKGLEDQNKGRILGKVCKASSGQELSDNSLQRVLSKMYKAERDGQKPKVECKELISTNVYKSETVEDKKLRGEDTDPILTTSIVSTGGECQTIKGRCQEPRFGKEFKSESVEDSNQRYRNKEQIRASMYKAENGKCKKTGNGRKRRKDSSKAFAAGHCEGARGKRIGDGNREPFSAKLFKSEYGDGQKLRDWGKESISAKAFNSEKVGDCQKLRDESAKLLSSKVSKHEDVKGQGLGDGKVDHSNYYCDDKYWDKNTVIEMSSPHTVPVISSTSPCAVVMQNFKKKDKVQSANEDGQVRSETVRNQQIKGSSVSNPRKGKGKKVTKRQNTSLQGQSPQEIKCRFDPCNVQNNAALVPAGAHGCSPRKKFRKNTEMELVEFAGRQNNAAVMSNSLLLVNLNRNDGAPHSNHTHHNEIPTVTSINFDQQNNHVSYTGASCDTDSSSEYRKKNVFAELSKGNSNIRNLDMLTSSDDEMLKKCVKSNNATGVHTNTTKMLNKRYVRNHKEKEQNSKPCSVTTKCLTEKTQEIASTASNVKTAEVQKTQRQRKGKGNKQINSNGTLLYVENESSTSYSLLDPSDDTCQHQNQIGTSMFFDQQNKDVSFNGASCDTDSSSEYRKKNVSAEFSKGNSNIPNLDMLTTSEDEMLKKHVKSNNATGVHTKRNKIMKERCVRHHKEKEQNSKPCSVTTKCLTEKTQEIASTASNVKTAELQKTQRQRKRKGNKQINSNGTHLYVENESSTSYSLLDPSDDTCQHQNQIGTSMFFDQQNKDVSFNGASCDTDSSSDYRKKNVSAEFSKGNSNIPNLDMLTASEDEMLKKRLKSNNATGVHTKRNKIMKERCVRHHKEKEQNSKPCSVTTKCLTEKTQEIASTASTVKTAELQNTQRQRNRKGNKQINSNGTHLYVENESSTSYSLPDPSDDTNQHENQMGTSMFFDQQNKDVSCNGASCDTDSSSDYRKKNVSAELSTENSNIPNLEIFKSIQDEMLRKSAKLDNSMEVSNSTNKTLKEKCIRNLEEKEQNSKPVTVNQKCLTMKTQERTSTVSNVKTAKALKTKHQRKHKGNKQVNSNETFLYVENGSSTSCSLLYPSDDTHQHEIPIVTPMYVDQQNTNVSYTGTSCDIDSTSDYRKKHLLAELSKGNSNIPNLDMLMSSEDELVKKHVKSNNATGVHTNTNKMRKERCVRNNKEREPNSKPGSVTTKCLTAKTTEITSTASNVKPAKTQKTKHQSKRKGNKEITVTTKKVKGTPDKTKQQNRSSTSYSLIDPSRYMNTQEQLNTDDSTIESPHRTENTQRLRSTQSQRYTHASTIEETISDQFNANDSQNIDDPEETLIYGFDGLGGKIVVNTEPDELYIKPGQLICSTTDDTNNFYGIFKSEVNEQEENAIENEEPDMNAGTETSSTDDTFMDSFTIQNVDDPEATLLYGYDGPGGAQV